LPDGYKRDYNCKNNAKWGSHCEHLSDHCGTSLVLRMKCKKTCGSCKEKFPVNEPKDKLHLDSPEFLRAVKELYVEKHETKDLREAQSEELLDMAKDVASDSLLEAVHDKLKAVHELQDSENFGNDETIELEEAQQAASQDLSNTEKDAEQDIDHISPYMQRMSSAYDDYFSVSSPSVVDDSAANSIISPFELSDVG